MCIVYAATHYCRNVSPVCFFPPYNPRKMTHEWNFRHRPSVFFQLQYFFSDCMWLNTLTKAQQVWLPCEKGKAVESGGPFRSLPPAAATALGAYQTPPHTRLPESESVLTRSSRDWYAYDSASSTEVRPLTTHGWVQKGVMPLSLSGCQGSMRCSIEVPSPWGVH